MVNCLYLFYLFEAYYILLLYMTAHILYPHLDFCLPVYNVMPPKHKLVSWFKNAIIQLDISIYQRP